MAEINPASAATTAAPRAAGINRFSEMSSEDFIKIIFTELTNQDPLKPSDSSALLEQMSSIRSIESDIKMAERLDSLVTENQLASAGNMIGKFIGGLSTDNNRVAGFVIAISRENDTVNLELDNGWTVPIDNVERLIDPDQLPDEGQDGDGA